MKKKTLLSWSSGKDSAWALHRLQQDPEIDVVGLFCTVNQKFDRVAMHGVRREFLELQAERVDLPLDIIDIPYPCSNDEYETQMSIFIDRAIANKIECCAFGDLYLEDVRQYRENNLKGTGITPLFPLWGMPTEELSREMVKSGLRAIITCIDPKSLPDKFVGREYDLSFLADIPEKVDPCGENGEFHSFAFEGPMFRESIGVSGGEIVYRDGFVFSELLLSTN